ncbi:MAG: DUF3021 family protein [Treponema sp.]|nr:DUF3021 family protein [Treponema sp.]
MKQTIIGIMVVTGAALVILAVFSILFSGETEIINARVVLEIFLTNIVIHIPGYFLRGKLEIRNYILVHFINISYLILVLVIFGLIFDWYSAIPVWLLIAMAIVIHLFVWIIFSTKIKRDSAEMNELLQKLREKQSNTES